MIKSITLKNFQSHQNTILELSPGLNVIKGSSHHGKSSIMRALKWVIHNRPIGDGFRSWFTDAPTVVIIEFDDGMKIARYKSNEENYYKINNNKYKALGTDVPPEVQQALQMTDVNLQSQDPDDKYFILKQTPGKRAKYLNSIVGLEIIDNTISGIKSNISTNNTKIKIRQEDRDNVKQKLDQLKDVDHLIDIIKQIDNLSINIQTATNQYTTIENISDEIADLKKEISNINKWLDIEKKLIKINLIRDKIKESIIFRNKLLEISSAIISHNNSINKSIRLLSAESDVKMFQNISSNLSKALDLRTSIQKIYNDIQNLEKTQKQALKRFDELDKERGKIKICPTCGQVICEEQNG